MGEGKRRWGVGTKYPLQTTLKKTSNWLNSRLLQPSQRTDAKQTTFCVYVCAVYVCLCVYVCAMGHIWYVMWHIRYSMGHIHYAMGQMLYVMEKHFRICTSIRFDSLLVTPVVSLKGVWGRVGWVTLGGGRDGSWEEWVFVDCWSSSPLPPLNRKCRQWAPLLHAKPPACLEWPSGSGTSRASPGGTAGGRPPRRYHRRKLGVIRG